MLGAIINLPKGVVSHVTAIFFTRGFENWWRIEGMFERSQVGVVTQINGTAQVYSSGGPVAMDFLVDGGELKLVVEPSYEAQNIIPTFDVQIRRVLDVPETL